MLPSRRVPLAWLNLTHNKLKLLGSLAGITFAVVLMFMEQGFQNSLLDGMLGLFKTFDADLVLISRSSYSMGFEDPFTRRHLFEARRFAEVQTRQPGLYRVGLLDVACPG